MHCQGHIHNEHGKEEKKEKEEEIKIKLEKNEKEKMAQKLIKGAMNSFKPFPSPAEPEER